MSDSEDIDFQGDSEGEGSTDDEEMFQEKTDKSSIA